MSTCQVVRNSAGNIAKVLNRDKTESKLFKQIASHPLVENPLEIFKNVYTDKVADENASFVNKVDGVIYPSYRQALLNAPENAKIEVGFQISDSPYISPYKVDPNQENITLYGVTQQLQKTGLAKKVHTLSPQQIEQELIRRGVDSNVAKQVVDYVKGYYSNANVAFSNLKDKNVKNVQGWMKALTDVQKNGGIRNVNQELEWIGLEDYLNEYVKENNPKAGNIPSSVVEDYIKLNQIEIVDVSKGGILSSKFDQEKYDDIEWQLNNFFEDGEFEPNEYNKGLDLLNSWRDNPNNSTFQAVVDFWNKQADSMNGQREDLRITNENTSLVSDDTKYSNYQLKGGENYREVLLTIPSKNKDAVFGEIEKEVDAIYRVYNEDRIDEEGFLTTIWKVFEENSNSFVYNALSQNDAENWIKSAPSDKIKIKETYIKEKGITDRDFQSSHWGEANILAHVRLNEKTLPDGRRVLIVNEVQSDWAQEGRKKGFAGSITKDSITKWEVTKDYGDHKQISFVINGEVDGIIWRPYEETEEQLKQRVVNTYNNISMGVLPATMPYKNTDQWVGLVIRRVMQMASQEGYDGIAFATGQQSVDMYSLAKQVEYISTDVTPMGRYVNIAPQSGMITVKVDDKGVVDYQSGSTSYGSFIGKPLSDIIGKDVADKILNSPDGTRLEGEDLEVGGEGMKTFYDKIVPKVVQKEARRFDKNAKLETVDFSEQPLRVVTNEDGSRILVDYTGEVVDSQYGSRFATDQEYIDAFKDAYNNSKGVTVAKDDKLSLGVQPYLPLTKSIKDSVSQGVPQFQKEGLGLLPNGFVDLNTKEVFLNQETANLDTPIHEFSHLFTNILKQTNPQLYKRGLELIEKEGKEYIDFVKQNQPNLKGEALLDEALNQAVGEAGERIINKQSNFFQWLQDMWNSLKDMLGLTQYSWNEVKDMSLQQFTEAMAVDLLRGEELRLSPILSTEQEIEQNRDVQVYITPATIRNFNEETLRLKELTNEYNNVAKEISQGNLENQEKFTNLQREILDAYQEHIEGKVSKIRGVNVSFNQPYLGSWQGKYEPSLNMTLSISPNADTGAISGLLFDIAENTSQDAFILEERSEIEGRTPLTEFDEAGMMHYPQFRVIFDKQLSVAEKSIIAQSLKNNGVEEFSIDGDYFIVSIIDFKSETNEQREKHYAEKSTTITTLFRGEGEKIGTNRVRDVQKHIRKSKYVGARNEGDEQSQTREYDRSDLFEAQPSNTGHQVTGEQDVQISNQESKAFNEGIEAVAKLADEYKKEFGIDSVRHNKVVKLFPTVSKMIAEAYEQAEAGMTTEEVKEAYKALERETLQQYKFIVDKGLKVSRWTGEGEPYPNSKSMLKDIRENNHLYFLPNSEAFGKEGDEVEGRAGLKLTDVYLEDGYRMTLSEVFRVVHDYFGHGILGNQFGAIGEENATLQHLDLYSFDALPAVIFQTRGQNSWVNFSGVNDEALRKIKEGSKTNNKNLLEEGQKEFRFATPKDNILPKIFNFKTYETARRIHEQEEIRKSETYLDPRGTYEDTYISELLSRLTSRNSGKLNGFSRRSLGVSKRLGGYDVDVIAEYEGNQELEGLIKKAFPQFKGTQKIYEISNGEVYRELMIKALETNKFKSSVTVHSAEDFSNMRLFVTEDGSTGITLTKEGFLGGGFSDPRANRPNNLAQLMLLGIKEGAITAEAFATILPDYYSMFGFKAVSRTAFNDEYRPLKENGALEDWDYELYSKFNNGRPDIVFLIYDGGNREGIQSRIGQFDDYKNYQKHFTEHYDKDSYDDAYRFMEVEAINKGNYQNQIKPATDNVGTFSAQSSDIRYQIDATPPNEITPASQERAGEFVPVIEIEKTTNKETRIGFINKSIEDGVLSDQKVKVADGSYRFRASGDTDIFRIINSEILEDDASVFLGRAGLGRDGTTFRLDKTIGTIRIGDKNIPSEYFTRATFEEIEKEYGEDVAIGAVSVNAYSEKVNRNEETAKKELKSEKELQLLLLNLLNKLGVKTLSISEYIEKYKMRNGKEPSAQALADIANQVVALAEGSIDTDALTEETAHFIVEAFDQTEVENLLRNIHKTQEYAEFAEAYRQVYSKEYDTAEEVEEAVRREILGKVLKNSLQAKFAQQVQNETQGNIISKLQDLFNRIIDTFRNFFKPQYKKDLDKFTEQVYELLYTEDIHGLLNPQNFKDNKFVLYQINPSLSTDSDRVRERMRKRVQAMVDTIRGQIHRAYRAEGSPTALEKQELQRLEEKLEKNEEVEAILQMITLTNNYIRRIDSVINKADKVPFTSEQNVVYHSLKNVLVKALAEVQILLPKADYSKEEVEKISKDIEDVATKMTKLEARATSFSSQALENLVDEIIERHNLPEDSETNYRERIKKWLEVAEYDTTLFHSLFGQITHSRDPLLGLVAVIGKDITMEKNIRTMESTNRMIQKLKDLGFDPKTLSQFVDAKSGTILSEYDWSSFYADMDAIYVEEYRKTVPNTELKDEEILANRYDLELKLSVKEKTELSRAVRRRQQELQERRMTDSYYNAFDERTENLNQITKDYLSRYYQDISALNSKAKKDGVIDLRNLSESDKVKYEDLVFQRKYYKSYYDHTGKLKKGLIRDADGNIVPNPHNSLSDEAIIAIDLNKLDSSFEKRGEATISEDFYTLLEQAFEQSIEDGIEFLKLNAYIGFSDTFWDELTANATVIQQLEGIKTGNNAREIDSIIEVIREKGEALKEILKQYKSKNNPSEIDVTRLETNQSTIETIKELQEETTEAYRKAFKLLEEKGIDTEGSTILTDTTTNEAYRKKIKDLGISIDISDSTATKDKKISEQIEFARKNATATNAKRLLDAKYYIDRYVQGKYDGSPHKQVEDILNELGLDVEDLHDVNVRVVVVEELISRNILPYYKRFAPSDYSAFMSHLNDPNVSSSYKVDNIRNIGNVFEHLVISPNSSFLVFDGANDLNPNYRNKFYGGAVQPKLSNPKYRNKAFYDLFGNVTYADKDDPYSGIAERNHKLYDAYVEVLKWNSEGLEAMDVDSSYNKYTLPQIRKNTIQRVVDLTKNISGTNIREAIEEALTFTPDEMIKGEQQYGDVIKVVPRRYVEKMKNQEDVSTDLFYSIATRNQEGFGREAILKHYGDMMAIGDAIERRVMKNGKDLKATNTYKMYTSYRDYILFGVKETWTYEIDVLGKKVDLAKVIRNLISYIKFRNLGLNFVIPITSAITGKTQLVIESLVGEHINRGSLSLGRKEFRNLLPEAMKEIGSQKKFAKYNVIANYFRADNIMGSLENSNYGFLARSIPKTGMGLHELSNLPIYGEIVMGVLHDYRIYNGRFVNFNNFKSRHKDKDSKEIKRLWSGLQDNTLYSFIDVENGQLSLNDRLKTVLTDSDGNLLSEQEYNRQVSNLIKGVQTRMGELILNVDTQIPMETRVAAQRSAILSLFLTHRSFLITNISRRTRSEFFNPVTGQIEEGTYRSLFNFIGESIHEMRKVGSKNIIKAFKEQWKNSDRHQKMNLRRVAVDLGVITFLGIIGLLISGYADDEDERDNYLLQGLSYFYTRLMNEMSSVQQVGSITSINEALETPIIGLNIVQGLTDVTEVFNSDIVQSGFYAGYTKRRRYLSKMLPLASQINYFESSDNLYRTRKMYEHFNRSNLKATPLAFIEARLEVDE